MVMKKKLIACMTLSCFLFVSFVSAQQPVRVERDLLGEKQVPADAYYGVQTARALENFKLSGVLINHYPGFVEAWAIVKLAAARANTDVGAMKPDRLAAIEKATAAIRDGRYHDQFLVDWYQGGAGTSTNMNANEVLANIGLELTGHKKGEYQFLEPHDDLNMSQSTNDSYPTALKVAFLLRNDRLIEELKKLVASFRLKGDAFIEIVKMGRTEMQDAVPMTVGQEFHAFAAGLEDEIKLLRDAEKYLYTVNMGATAIGTGLNAPKGYAEKCALHLARLTGKPIVPATDMLAATWDQQGFVVYSSALKSLAIKLSKIASDLILLASGPRAGLAEMESQSLLYNVSGLLRTKCIDGITTNEQVLSRYMETTVGIVTALNPVLGYEKATELANEAYKSGKGILEIIREKKILTEAQIKDLLDPVKLSGLDKSKYPKNQ